MYTNPSLESKTLLFSVDGHVATICINRPDKLNPVNLQIVGDIVSILEQAEGDEEINSVIVKAAGTQGHIPYAGDMAGADLGELQACRANFEYREYYRKFSAYLAKLRNVDLPVIGVCNGYVFGAGMGLAACADIVVATDKSSFGMLEINYGFPGGPGILTKLLGRHKAAEVLFLGRTFDAREALRIGLINQVVEEQNLEETVNKITKRINKQSRKAVVMAKRLINFGLSNGVDDTCEYELAVAPLCLNTPEAQSRIDAFLKK